MIGFQRKAALFFLSLAVAFEQVERGLKAEERALKRLHEHAMISSAEYQQNIAQVRRKLRLLQKERRETLTGK